MRYASEHKAQTRDRILLHAARAIRELGPREVRVAAVMLDAGLTHGGFYAHFGSKDALIEASIASMFDDSRALWDRATRKRSLTQGLLGYVDLYLSSKHLDERAEGCPMVALAAEVPRLPSGSRQAFSEGIASLSGLIRDRLSEIGCKRAGPTATSLLAELVGSLTLARLQTDRTEALRMLRNSRQELKRQLRVRITPCAEAASS